MTCEELSILFRFPFFTFSYCSWLHTIHLHSNAIETFELPFNSTNTQLAIMSLWRFSSDLPRRPFDDILRLESRSTNSRRSSWRTGASHKELVIVDRAIAGESPVYSSTFEVAKQIVQNGLQSPSAHCAATVRRKQYAAQVATMAQLPDLRERLHPVLLRH